MVLVLYRCFKMDSLFMTDNYSVPFTLYFFWVFSKHTIDQVALNYQYEWMTIKMPCFHNYRDIFVVLSGGLVHVCLGICELEKLGKVVSIIYFFHAYRRMWPFLLGFDCTIRSKITKIFRRICNFLDFLSLWMIVVNLNGELVRFMTKLV